MICSAAKRCDEQDWNSQPRIKGRDATTTAAAGRGRMADDEDDDRYRYRSKT